MKKNNAFLLFCFLISLSVQLSAQEIGSRKTYGLFIEQNGPLNVKINIGEYWTYIPGITGNINTDWQQSQGLIRNTIRYYPNRGKLSGFFQAGFDYRLYIETINAKANLGHRLETLLFRYGLEQELSEDFSMEGSVEMRVVYLDNFTSYHYPYWYFGASYYW